MHGFLQFSEEKDNIFKSLVKSQREFSFGSFVATTVERNDFILEKKYKKLREGALGGDLGGGGGRKKMNFHHPFRGHRDVL